MSKTATLQLSFGFAGDGFPNAQPWMSGPIINTPSVTLIEPVMLNAGSTTTIPVPSGCLFVVLMPVPGATFGKTFKTNNGDTGTVVSTTQPWAMVFQAGSLPANIYVAATGVGSEQLYVGFG